jgi:hypothetical protein
MGDTVQAFLADGRFVDAILVLMVVECVGLIAYRRVTGRGIEPGAVIANLIAGGALLVALRAMLTGWGLPVIGLCMAVSGAAHVADLQRRWRG